jgi:hypothetical protein
MILQNLPSKIKVYFFISDGLLTSECRRERFFNGKAALDATNPIPRIELMTLRLATFLAIGISIGCSNPTPLGGKSLGKSSKKSDSSGNTNPGGNSSEDVVKVVEEDKGPQGPVTDEKKITGAAFQLKDLQEVKGNLTECLGQDLTVVKQEMLITQEQAGFQPDQAGRMRFLLSGYTAGEDVLRRFSASIGDPETLPRGDTLALSPTISYFEAMKVIANVVAFNCDLEAPDSRCDCRGKEKAAKVLKACLPSISQAELASKSEVFGQRCSVSNLDARRSLAGFVASGIFSKK